MDATDESLKRVRELAEDPVNLDQEDKREWDRLIRTYNKLHSGKPAINPNRPIENEELIEILATVRDKLQEEGLEDFDEGCGDDNPCGDPKIEKIDLENLAELVFQRLVFEARIEAERTGWAA